MLAGSSGAVVARPSRSTHTSTVLPAGVPSGTSAVPSRRLLPGQAQVTRTATRSVVDASLPSPLSGTAGARASSSETACARVRSAASAAASAPRWLVAADDVRTAAGGARTNARTTATRPATCSRSERRRSGPEPSVNRRSGPRRTASRGAVIAGAQTSARRLSCSNSAWSIVPSSSRRLARAISSTLREPGAATERM